MKVYEAIAHRLRAEGVAQVFGVAGSGNYRVTRELVNLGADYLSARHEAGAISMADGFARASGRLPVVSVHQGCGLTNIVTGLTEAVKSRTPILILTGEPPLYDRFSNFRIHQDRLVEAVGARSIRVHAETVSKDVCDAMRIAVDGSIPVVLNMPTDVQMRDVEFGQHENGSPKSRTTLPDADSVRLAADMLLDAQSPLILAGRGARGAGRELRELAEKSGSLVATSAVARGLFADDDYSLDVMGDLSCPAAVDLIVASDLIVAFGCGLGNWTLGNGSLIGKRTQIVQIDSDALAIGRNTAVSFGLVGDTRATSLAIGELIPDMEELRNRRRTPAMREFIGKNIGWPKVPFTDLSDPERVDPRAVTIALNSLIDAERNIAVDSGNFLGYPTMFLDVPDEDALTFSQAFQCVGLGLSSAIGHAIARPDRLTVAACGDGGFLMSTTELDTLGRISVPMMVLIYNDAGYGAEVHHFGVGGEPDGFVSFDDKDLAAIARGYGLEAVTVRNAGADLEPVRAWLDGPRSRALVVDMKVSRSQPSWWLADAFKAEP